MKKLMLLATALTLGFAISTTTLSANTFKGGDGKDGKACTKKCTKACKGGEASKCTGKGEAKSDATPKKADTKKSN